jgi:hypothetical protein
MKINLGWIVAALLGVALFLTQRFQCGSDWEKEAEIKKVQDSMVVVFERERKSDSLIKDLYAEIAFIDSSRQVAEVKREVVENELFKSERIAVSLAHQLQQAKKDKDTVTYYASCDSLAREVIAKDGKLQSYVDYTDSIEAYYKGELVLKDSVINERQRLYAALRVSFDGLSRDYIEFIKKQPKKTRWSVGPAVGGGIGTDSKVRGYAGISLQYSLIKF